jgi:hypothetical protein
MKDFRIKWPFVCYCKIKPHGGALSTYGPKGEDIVEPHGGALSTYGSKGEDIVESLGMSLHPL